MKDRINELKEAFRNAKTDEERKAVDVAMKELASQNADEFATAMIECVGIQGKRLTL